VYEYFHYENAYYRRKEGYINITEVKTPTGWQPYTGSDATSPWVYGDMVTEKEAMQGV
jgi:hypothetical protein